MIAASSNGPCNRTVNRIRTGCGSVGRSFRLVTSGIGNSGSLYRSGHRMGFQQDANPCVSLAAADLSTRTGRHRSWDHSNDRRTLVIHSLDDGRSSQARSRAFVAASKSTMPDALGAKTPIATLHLQLVGQSDGQRSTISSPTPQGTARPRRATWLRVGRIPSQDRPVVVISVEVLNIWNAQRFPVFGRAGFLPPAAAWAMRASR